jgi:hypothetical protein
MISFKKQLFDLGYLNRLEDTDLISEVINLYLEETQIDLLKIKMALDKADYATIHLLVDRLKISTGMIQADSLYLILEEMGAVSKYGGEYSKMCDLGYIAQNEFDQLKYELGLYLKNIHRFSKNDQPLPNQSTNKVYSS